MIKYSGKVFTSADLDLIRKLIADNPSMHRTALSELVCQHLNWYQLDGGLKAMRCRAVMLQMQSDGLINLPSSTRKVLRPDKSIKHTDATNPQEELNSRVDAIKNLRLELVNKTTTLLWNEYIDRYHYLGFTKLPGSQLRYLAYADDQLVACLGFGAAAWKTAPRDQFIGWTQDQRKNKLHLVVNNARFLILPWIKSKNLASKLLSMVAKRIASDWQNRYNYQPVLLETFVETGRFTGACYKAANWIVVGKTKGRGRGDGDYKFSLPIKDVLLFPLGKKFKSILCSDTP